MRNGQLQVILIIVTKSRRMVVGVRSTHGRREMHTKFWSRNLTKKYRLSQICVVIEDNIETVLEINRVWRCGQDLNVLE